MYNLVEGGARRGWFMTRHSRKVHILEPFEFAEAPQPGQEPVKRICWRGEMFLADGHTLDTILVWETSGATQNPNGVIQRTDLVIVLSLDPEPEPPAALIEEAEPADKPKRTKKEMKQHKQEETEQQPV